MLTPPEIARSFLTVGESKAKLPLGKMFTLAVLAGAYVALGFGDALLRGILCNLLVCLAVWMAAGAKRPEGKLLALFFPIMLLVLCGYEHCIANFYYLPVGAFVAAEYGIDAALPLSGCLRNLAAVTLGNLVGGVSLGLAYRFAYLK